MNAPDLPERLRSALAEYALRVRDGMADDLRDVRLFGSWARGEAGPDSDVDVWLLVARRDDRARMVPYEASMRVLLDHGVDIAPTVMDEAEWQTLLRRERRLGREIVRDGIPL